MFPRLLPENVTYEKLHKTVLEVYMYIGLKIVFLLWRAIHWPERENVIGGSRKLDNENLHDICCSTNIIHVV